GCGRLRRLPGRPGGPGWAHLGTPAVGAGGRRAGEGARRSALHAPRCRSRRPALPDPRGAVVVGVGALPVPPPERGIRTFVQVATRTMVPETTRTLSQKWRHQRLTA